MCEANETLQKARHALEVMIGNQILDLGRLRQILDTNCPHHERTN